jgi:UDP-N-acetylglucosamine--N-acetylmuramyl-(pentapeptide) pyrophosphoryl-undecaprenol N-acetylglucosamine transferase
VDGEVLPFADDMPKLFAQADLVVSRSGMGTVSELAAAGRPAILVPLPTASDQHQLRNAEAFAKAGAGILVLDAEMTGARLLEEVTRLAKHPETLAGMGKVARKLARPGAARRAAEVLEEVARHN